MIQPLAHRVLVRRDEAAKESKGGILLPDNAKERPQRGTVLAIGPGMWNEARTARVPMEISVGQRVLFSAYAGSEIEEQGEKLSIMNESDILAVSK
jgi:chaperonin GroES